MDIVNKAAFAITATGANDYKASERKRQAWDEPEGWDELPFG